MRQPALVEPAVAVAFRNHIFAQTVFIERTHRGNKGVQRETASGVIIGNGTRLGPEHINIATTAKILEEPQAQPVIWSVSHVQSNELGQVTAHVARFSTQQRLADEPMLYRPADRRLDIALISVFNQATTQTTPPGTVPFIDTARFPALQLTPASGHCLPGAEIAWAGYPAFCDQILGSNHLCYYQGVVSAYASHPWPLYLIDGNAPSGVQGGPVWFCGADGRPIVLGVIAAPLSSRQPPMPAGSQVCTPINVLLDCLVRDRPDIVRPREEPPSPRRRSIVRTFINRLRKTGAAQQEESASVVDAPWIGWMQSDGLPCFFSTPRSSSNAAFLAKVLSKRFVRSKGNIRKGHPLLKLWDQQGVDSYLRLNGLAEDLRLVSEKPHFEEVLRDLKVDRSCDSAWHTIHTAALFERANSGGVKEFVASHNDSSIPDFILNYEGQDIAVEAKLLTRSDTETAFANSAELLVKAALVELQHRPDALALFIVIRDALKPPSKKDLISALRNMKLPEGLATTLTIPGAHLQVEHLVPDSNLIERRLIYVLAPLHEKEYLRIRNPAKSASSQLRAADTGDGRGLLALGLTREQNSSFVFDFLEDQMRKNNLRAIGATLLIKTGTHLQPPRRTVIDLLEVRPNLYGTKPLTTPLLFKSIDLSAVLTDAETPSLGVPAYRYSIVQGKIVDASKPVALTMPDIRRIAAQLLEETPG
jgi:hypothetical protein